MRPIIGITPYFVKGYEMGVNRVRGLKGQDMIMGSTDYTCSIQNAGGIPILVPLINKDDYINEIISSVNGLLFTGGPDISPSYYNDHTRAGIGMIVPERDDFEFKLLSKAIENKVPILGICRGAQLINCHFGGTLYQDINLSQITNINHTATNLPKYSESHKVEISPNSILGKIYRQPQINVNSFHHQCIKELGEGLTKTAWASDGIVEGFEKTDYPFLLGVQWHPEMMSEFSEQQLNLFRFFISSIAIKKK